jgi:hypothetical protein
MILEARIGVLEMKSYTVDLEDDTHDYLEFLKLSRFIKDEQEALQKALVLFKKLAMHSWLPTVYRIGESRVILMDRGMLLDVFELLSEPEIYRAGNLTAMKRKVLKPEFRDIDLTKPYNWMIVLKELENFGWGAVEKVGNEIRVEDCAVPVPYLRGYLETMFKVRLVEHKTKVQGLTIFIAHPRETDDWR